MKRELLDWLSTSMVDAFATISLKQGIENADGHWSRLTTEHAVRTGWLLRDRLTKAVVGKKQKIPFLVFSEGDGTIKRRHLHIATQVPDNMRFQEFADMLRFKAVKLDWVYNEIDIRPIIDGTARRAIAYSLKEGIEAFIPEASFIPFKN